MASIPFASKLRDVHMVTKKFMSKSLNKLLRMIRYVFRYSASFMPARMNALNFKESIDLIARNKLSLIRWGDGETSVLLGYDIAYQVSTPELREKMWNIINTYNHNGHNNSGFILAMPLKYLSVNGYDLTINKLCHYWVHTRYIYKTRFNHDRTYADAFLFSENMNIYFEKIWNDASHIIFVHSDIRCFKYFCESYHKDSFFVQIPAKNCFEKYKEIYTEIIDIFEKNCLDTKKTYVLISAGPAAKVVTFDLAQKGYICIDTGHCWDEPLSKNNLLV